MTAKVEFTPDEVMHIHKFFEPKKLGTYLNYLLTQKIGTVVDRIIQTNCEHKVEYQKDRDVHQCTECEREWK